MSDIRSEIAYIGPLFREKLRQKIQEVLDAIQESDDNIVWIITERLHVKRSFGGIPYQTSPAWADPHSRRIYINISLLTSHTVLSNVPCLFPYFHKKNDVLANVIMDEIAHIKTGKDHGTTEYDETLMHYHERYYNKNFFPLLDFFAH